MQFLLKIAKCIKSVFSYIYYTLKLHKTDFFQYKKLVNPSYDTIWGFTSVLLYGNWKAIAKLKGSRFRFLTEYLEHGTVFYTNVESAEYPGYINRKGIKKIYTFSEIRKALLDEYLKQHNLTDRTVVAVGPYIKGAKHFYSSKILQDLKQKYGRILLVYPSHSIETVKVKYDLERMSKAIESVRSHFDTVFISLYWKDILDKTEEVNFYEKCGYIVVCSGHRSDPQFLSRQKDLMFLADMIMTNDMGSHVGYAVCMNRPVYFVSQHLQISHNEEKDFNDGKIEARKECESLFASFSFEITKDQKDFIRKYWGPWDENVE